jgi:DNA-binding SARP family transcriptional activator
MGVVGATGDVDVAALGPVVVRGAAEPFRRPAALDLAVYLAFHRYPVSHAEWSLALWPDYPVAPATVHSTASDCRRALGRTSGGAPYLARGARLKLAGSLTTDVERFADLAAPGDPESALRAMALVRGPFLAGLRRTDWAVLDGTQARVEALVVETALEGAERCLRSDRGGDAETLVRQALRLCPYDERLYRMLLRAREAQGNRVGLRSLMAELCLLSGEGGAGDGLHPETTALYRVLIGHRPAAEAHPTSR